MVNEGKSGNLILDKTFKYAVKIINLYKVLSEEKHEYVLSKQVLRSGTSIGANVSEGVEAQSKKDFISKLSIALKEACETKYWLNLLKETSYISNDEGITLLNDLNEIIRILRSILITSKQRIDKN